MSALIAKLLFNDWRWLVRYWNWYGSSLGVPSLIYLAVWGLLFYEAGLSKLVQIIPDPLALAALPLGLTLVVFALLGSVFARSQFLALSSGEAQRLELLPLDPAATTRLAMLQPLVRWSPIMALLLVLVEFYDLRLLGGWHPTLLALLLLAFVSSGAVRLLLFQLSRRSAAFGSVIAALLTVLIYGAPLILLRQLKDPLLSHWLALALLVLASALGLWLQQHANQQQLTDSNRPLGNNLLSPLILKLTAKLPTADLLGFLMGYLARKLAFFSNIQLLAFIGAAFLWYGLALLHTSGVALTIALAAALGFLSANTPKLDHKLAEHSSIWLAEAAFQLFVGVITLGMLLPLAITAQSLPADWFFALLLPVAVVVVRQMLALIIGIASTRLLWLSTGLVLAVYPFVAPAPLTTTLVAGGFCLVLLVFTPFLEEMRLRGIINN
jgi:hypothetical protein